MFTAGSWSSPCLQSRGSDHKQPDSYAAVTLSQVHAFLHPSERRKAPVGWWIKPPPALQAARPPKKDRGGDTEVPLAQLAQRSAQKAGLAPALAAAAELAQVGQDFLAPMGQCSWHDSRRLHLCVACQVHRWQQSHHAAAAPVLTSSACAVQKLLAVKGKRNGESTPDRSGDSR